MPLNYPALEAAIYAAFRKQSSKPGPGKVGVEKELSIDIATAIDLYVRSGTVMTTTADAHTGVGLGITAPHPFFITYPVFTVTAGTGVGAGLGKVV